jgi:Tfp pilus assembly protein PilV
MTANMKVVHPGSVEKPTPEKGTGTFLLRGLRKNEPVPGGVFNRAVRPHFCRGFSIVEAMATIALLSVAVIATARVLAVCARQRMTSQQWLAAQLEAANVQEHIAAMPYEKVSPSTMELLQLPPSSRAILPHATLRIDVADSKNDEPKSKRIRVEVSWPQFASDGAADSTIDEPPLCVELTAWKFPAASEATP